MADRSARAEVRNPVLVLPGMAALMNLPAPIREGFAVVPLDLAADARSRAVKAWASRKGPMAVYWQAVAVYAKHTARALRRGAEVRS